MRQLDSKLSLGPILALSTVSLSVLSFACSSGGPGRDRDSVSQNGPSTGVPSYGPPPSTMVNPEGNPMTGTPPESTPNPTPVGEMTDNELLVDGLSTGRLGSASMGGTGSSSDQWQKAEVTRDGQNYFFMANGWGPGWDSHVVSWEGTSFTVESLLGEQGPEYQPASFPTVFCGVYSDSRSRECGLPAALDSITSLQTGWSWQPNGNDGEYNASYDIWMGTGTERNSHSGFLMVWFREPIGQQPAGSRTLTDVTVEKVPGTWDIWTGSVGGLPIINWVRGEGEDTLSMEFDVMDFVRDAQQRGLEVPGTHILSVATGFEIWNGPVTNLESIDFYVDVQ